MKWAVVILALLAWASPAFADGYVVLRGVGEKDAYAEAGALLAQHHGTQHVLRFDPAKPNAVLPALRKIEPAFVAIVVRPEQIHVNTVRAILRMATQVDEDPFVDFAFGYITGASAEEAVQFVRNIIRASKTERPRKLGQASVWGGQGTSSAFDDVYAEGPLRLPRHSLRFRSPDGTSRDQAFIDEHLASLNGCGAILMGGHGMPWELVHGPQGEDIGKLDLFPAVAFNFACHTGVTGRYPEREWKFGATTERFKEVEAKKSFALNMIRSGVTGYVAWVNPRPAGPEVHTDYARMLAGETLGATRRRDYDKIALGYLGYGEQGIVPPPWKAGQEHAAGTVDAVRHMMLDGATGGILYGDPALRPFPVTKGALPLRAALTRKEDVLAIRLSMPARASWLFCADPFRKFPGGTNGMARKLYERFELPEDAPEIKGVWVTSATQGGQELATLPVVWALEEDRGRRYLHVKAGFDYGREGDIEFALIAAPREAPPEALRVHRPKPTQATPASGETPLDAQVRAVNQRALNPRTNVRKDLKALKKLGEPAFDAVVKLIAQGKGHWRTNLLVGATKPKGGEKKLMALVDGPALPGYGRWTALACLGEFDTPAVRDYLLKRLAKERNAGLFFSTAKALAALKEAKAFAPIARQLLAFEEGWSGVEYHLLAAIVTLGGPSLAETLEKFATDERAKEERHVTMALAYLENLDRKAAQRTAKAVVASPRFAAWTELTRTQIRTLVGTK